jgi:hypothetical protein
VSGLDSVLARIGAIERRVSGVPTPGVVGGSAGTTSFAATLDQATALDKGGSSDRVTGLVRNAATASTLLPSSGSARSVIRPEIPSTAAPHGRATGAPTSTASSYRPAHVTETDERVWNDCTWASAAMWIDKLTGGKVKVDREALRAASGDKSGGSSLGDVVRGARKLLGLDLRAAHAEHLTVNGLLDRLAAGGGAIVQGSYASLPSHLTRHDPGFAAQGTGNSGHAVYVGPLDRATGKVWWDDPLARAGGSGEWISVKDLKKFLWTDGHGRVSAMATPAAGSNAPAASRSAARSHAGTSQASARASAEAASISAAARSTGVDPLLLRAYLDVAHTPSGPRAIAAGADDLSAALARYGRADLALESLGAAQAGSARLAGGAVFAGDVLTEWAELLDRSPRG